MDPSNAIECYTTLQWTDEGQTVQEVTGGDDGGGGYIVEAGNLNEIAPDHLIYMTEDGQRIGIGDLIEEEPGSAQEETTSVDTFTQEECEITEEIVTQDWVQGDDCVQEVTVIDQIDPESAIVDHAMNATDIIPLPEAQDEYTASRPYPCDFCSRRFRKKANLMNHMIAHQNDRPHVCNLCGARYIRKSDLLNHLKTHAYTEDGYNGMEDQDLVNFLDDELNGSRGGNKMNIDLEELLSSPGTFNSSMGTTFTHQARPNIQRMKKPVNRQMSRAKTFPTHSTKAKKKPKPKTHVVRTPIRLNVSNSESEEAPMKYPVTNPSKPFVCQRCGVAFARSKALTSHMRFHSGDILHECNVCGQQFYDKALYQKHFAKHFDERTELPNLAALTTFKKVVDPVKDEFDEEATESDVEVGDKYDDTLFECHLCLISFHRIDLFEKHMLAHESPGKLKGLGHDISGSSLDVSQEGHYCNVCGERFLEALDLIVHAETHSKYHPLKCLLCGEQFHVESDIKIHLMEMHRNEMTENTCRLCGKLCKDGRTLIRHSWDHSSDDSYSCARCAKSFHNKARLKRHMTSHKNKTVMCDTCGDELQDGRSLLNHKHLHTKSNQFHCSECGKTFGSRSSQQIHMRIHTGEKPYGCRYCYKAFADGGTLRKHERIHTGEKPYACPVCPRAFNQRVVLREHIRSHHSAPDMKLNSSVAQYYCPVCGNTFLGAQDLIKHLIEHSDANTQAKRQPQNGPRKYKRRRNIQSPGGKRSLRKSQSSSMEFDDNLDDEDIQEMSIEDYATQTFRKFVPLNPRKEDFCLPEQMLNDRRNMQVEILTLDVPRTARSKPKMIHTEKTRVVTTDGNKRKTRTFISKTSKDMNFLTLTPSKIKPEDESFPLLDDGKPLSEETSPVHDVPLDEDFLLDIVKKSKYSDKFNSDIVNDLKEILQSPVKGPKGTPSPEEEHTPPPTNATRRSRRHIKPTPKAMESPITSTSTASTSYTSRIRIQNRKTSLEPEDIKPLENNIKDEEKEEETTNECQICGDNFQSRTLLIAHAQVHI